MVSEVSSLDKYCYPETFDSAIWQRVIRTPIGYLPHIRIGDIWQNGSMLMQPDYSTVEIKLRIFPEHTRIIKSGVSREENADFILPFDRHPYHQAHTNSYCLMVESEKASLIIPSIELIRFYFGSSSNLIAGLFSAPFQEEKFWTAIEQGEDNITRIALAAGISGYSAADVTRIAMNETAKRAARLVGESCMAAAAMKESIHPKAIFPFQGKSDLLVRGIWLGSGNDGRKTFLVFQILSCSHSFPFGSLRYTLEKKPISISADDPEGGEGKNRRIGRSGDLNRDFPLDDKEPSSKLSKREIAIKRYVRFPDLSTKNIWRVEKETQRWLRKTGQSVKW